MAIGWVAPERASPGGGRALIIAAGSVEPEDFDQARYGPFDLVVAADGGLDHALRLGVRVDVVVGDMDSVSSAAVERYRSAEVEWRPASTDKDFSDLDLALSLVLERHIESATVIGIGGGRFDRELTNMAVLSSDRYAALAIDAWARQSHVAVVHSRVELTVAVGATVTLLAMHGDAERVTTDGLRWNLRGQTLPAGVSLGVSNVATQSDVSIEVDTGCVLAVTVRAT